jgi:hypothetical protein
MWSAGTDIDSVCVAVRIVGPVVGASPAHKGLNNQFYLFLLLSLSVICFYLMSSLFEKRGANNDSRCTLLVSGCAGRNWQEDACGLDGGAVIQGHHNGLQILSPEASCFGSGITGYQECSDRQARR